MEQPDDPGIDISRPNAARMYDYYLGGSASFEVDRRAAEAGARALPDAAHYAQANRAFLGRAVRHLVNDGIDQFLDLGSGIPTKGNVHEIAQQLDPNAHVSYVDMEPVAVAHAHRLLTGNALATVTQADIREPDTVLAAPGVAELLDFTRPVAVLAVAILPFVTDDTEMRALIDRYRQACAPGSHLVLSHISPLAANDDQVSGAEEVMAETPTPVRWRTADRLVPLFDGYEILPPGLVPVPRWRPDQRITAEQVARANSFGAVGKLRG